MAISNKTGEVLKQDFLKYAESRLPVGSFNGILDSVSGKTLTGLLSDFGALNLEINFDSLKQDFLKFAESQLPIASLNNILDSIAGRALTGLLGSFGSEIAGNLLGGTTPGSDTLPSDIPPKGARSTSNPMTGINITG